jgi:hypothetical protein
MTHIQKAQQASIKPTALATALALECLLHGTDSPPINAPDIPGTASKVSQSQF